MTKDHSIKEDLFCKQCQLRFVDKSVFQIHFSILHSDKIDHNVPKKKLLLVSLTESRKESNSCQTISVKEQHFVEQSKHVHETQKVTEKDNVFS